MVFQQVPRAEIEAGEPREVTVAPKVALVKVILEEVGEVTVGKALAAQVDPFQVEPEAQVAVTAMPAPLGEVGTSDLALL